MSQHHHRTSGRQRKARNARILAVSDICHICGHAGSDSIDHVVALARGGSDTDPANLKPAHYKPCPTCGEPCNGRKGDREWTPIIRRSPSLDRP